MNFNRFFQLSALVLLLMSSNTQAYDLTEIYPHNRSMQSANRYVHKGDMQGAHKMYLEAASWGHKEAQKLIGLQYLDGQGVSQDYVQAYAWLKLAASFGDNRTKLAFKDMQSTLDEDTLAKGEDAFDGLQKKYGDEAVLKRRKKWARKELKENKASGARRPSRNTQVSVATSPGRMTTVTMGELMDILDAYVDDFEKGMEGA